MLKGIDPLLTPELLKIMMEMGHDDAIVVADANFTAVRYAQGKPIIRLPGHSVERVVQALTSLLPLVADETHPAGYMHVSGQPEGFRSAQQREVLRHIEPQILPGQSVEAIERYAFYERCRSAFAFIVTGELQPFGNFLLRKGVIGENLRP